jgi:CLIP-associating protein 1/2
VHTAERSLECLVKCLDPGRCLYSLLPFLCGDLEADENGTPSVILVSLRTLAFLVERVPNSMLQDVKPSLIPCLSQSLHNRSVDMRKAAVFVLVEIHFALGNGFLNSQELALTAAQQKLISIYIQRHKKTQEADPAFAFVSQTSSPPLVSR